MCFLDFNGYWLDKCDDLELFEFTRKIAAHEIAADRKNEIKVIKIFLKKNSRKRKYEDQQLSLHALTQHLNNAGFKLIITGSTKNANYPSDPLDLIGLGSVSYFKPILNISHFVIQCSFY